MLRSEIIDNSSENNLLTFLRDSLKDNYNTKFDIATAFFEIKAYGLIKDELDGVEKFRLLLGKMPEMRTNSTLGDILKEDVMKEIKGMDLSKENDDIGSAFINFLERDNVEIRLFEDFLHAKTYIFEDRVIIGSSNFTVPGLTRFGELNKWGMKSEADHIRKEWFEKFWTHSRDFKQELLALIEESRFGSREYTPYEIFIKTLYEFQKDDIQAQEFIEDKGNSLVNLAEFQEDAIYRVLSRLDKYGGVIVADSVGLGKTHIALKVIEHFHIQQRKNRPLIICPAQIRDLVWRKELKDKVLPEYIISQEEIGSQNFLDKVKESVGGNLGEIELIVVDESHNFRNPMSNRWEHLFQLINDHITPASGKKPKILFLTATPINNGAWDLYWQIMLLLSMDRTAFIKENIPDLFEFFKQAENSPNLLNDLLNEISIRRTRDYILKNYPNAYIGNDKSNKITFPERKLENINYQLDKTYNGMYNEIADIISNKLTMAYYKMLEYRIGGIETEEERLQLGRMISVGGIFRTILLKRLESSVNAFKISINRQISFLEYLKKCIENGKIINKTEFSKILKNFECLSSDDVDEYFSSGEQLDNLELTDFNKDNYAYDDLMKDLDTDIGLFRSILNKVNTIGPEDDSKLEVLKEKLLELSKEGQIILFAYYADTLDYIYEEIIKDPRFKELTIEAVSSSGKTSRSGNQRVKLVNRFTGGKIDILLSTDVLSEGQNLQSAKFLINYDLHWNPTRMIQRAGRIDRIGSPYKKIYICNFFPEQELEELLNLLKILKNKINNINDSLGLDGSVLGEKINTKVFGIIRAIKDKDKSVFEELEDESFAGGEKFYQPLKDFMKEKSQEELQKIPYGVYSGLKDGEFAGIFFYYKYGDDFHYWYLYDLNKEVFLTNKSQIFDFVSCDFNEKRWVPDFFDKVYEINEYILGDIEKTYKSIELKTKESLMQAWSSSMSTKFLKSMLDAIGWEVEEYLNEYPADNEIQNSWDKVQEQIVYIPHTKKGLQKLRKIWKEYKNHYDWKKTLMELDEYVESKSALDKNTLEPFDKSKLQLITIDYIS
ncbi:helicase-related protein [Methanobacterium bryantii]|nr:helicase-related protein [Methanobacterium bryantii]